MGQIEQTRPSMETGTNQPMYPLQESPSLPIQRQPDYTSPAAASPEPPQPTHHANGNGRVQKSYQQQAGGLNPAMVHPTPLHLLRETSAMIDCPHCNMRGPTRVDESDSSMTIIAGIGIGIFCICAACLPCLLHWFPDVDHFCSHCHQRVAHVPHGGVAQVLISPAAAYNGNGNGNMAMPPQGYAMNSQPVYGGASSSSPSVGFQQPQQQSHSQYGSQPGLQQGQTAQTGEREVPPKYTQV